MSSHPLPELMLNPLAHTLHVRVPAPKTPSASLRGLYVPLTRELFSVFAGAGAGDALYAAFALSTCACSPLRRPATSVYRSADSGEFSLYVPCLRLLMRAQDPGYASTNPYDESMKNAPIDRNRHPHWSVRPRSRFRCYLARPPRSRSPLPSRLRLLIFKQYLFANCVFFD